MTVKKFISISYPVADAFSGIKQVEDDLLKNGYLVVFNEGKYVGILTPNDVILRPHKLVIDCLTKKRRVESTDALDVALNTLNESNSLVLPVYEDNQYAGIIRKVDVITSLSDQTKDLQKKLQLAETLKSEFLSNLSHEIRTPLNGIIPFVEILSDVRNSKIQNNRDELSVLLEKAIDRFLNIMEDLIQLSLFESGHQVEITVGTVDVLKMFEEISYKAKQHQQFTEKNLSINYCSFDSSLILITDALKLKRVFSHLVDNAIKFCSAGGIIEIGLNCEEESNLIFTVKNTGIKIENDDPIFEAFQRRKNSTEHYSEGLGIGLTLSKKLIRLLGGDIWVTKENPDKTVFGFSITRILSTLTV